MKLFQAFIICLVSLFIPNTYACTGFFVQGSTHPIVAKNLDWMFDQGIIYINKRHMQKKADLIDTSNALEWTSKYMSLTITQDGLEFPWEGINEEGLTVNVFQLVHSIVPNNTDPRPSIEVTQWIQYILDTSASLEDAILNAQKVRISQTMRQPAGEKPETTAHYLVCDINSHCGVFEYINGELVIYNSQKNLPYSALANDQYQVALKYYHLQNPIDMNSAKSASLDRFSRAVHWSNGFVKSNMNEIDYAFLGLKNVAQHSTHWSMVFNLSEKTVTLFTSRAPLKKQIYLNEFNPSCLSPVKALDLNASNSGKLTPKNFHDFSKEENEALLKENTILTNTLQNKMAAYPAAMTRCVE